VYAEISTGNIDQYVTIKEVVRGHTVYFGEEHLDVTACVGSNPTWVVALDLVRNVTDTIEIPKPADFNMPTDKPENNWYQATGPKSPVYDKDGNPILAFISQEPVLSFDIWNLNTDMIAASQVQRGTLLQFKLSTETNLDDITTRTDYNPSKGYINFSVQAPGDDQYLELTTLGRNSGKVEYFVPTTGLHVKPSPAWTWPKNLNSTSSDPTGWMTGWRDAGTGQETDYFYKIGSYTITGLCNVNNMFKNRQRQGFTWDTKQFEMTSRSVTVAVNAPAGKNRDNKFTAVVTGMPNTSYQIFISDECPTKLTGKICDRPPYIMGTRAELLNKGISLDPEVGPYPIGSTVVVDCCKEGLKIRETLPSGDAYPSQGAAGILENGTRYYAEITTDSSGRVEIPFWIDTTVGAGIYVIQVQDVLYQQKDSKPVQVSLGQVTAEAKNTEGTPGSIFFVGDEIWIDGTNSDSNMSYLWITGPGLDPCGVNLYDPTSADPVEAVVYDTRDGKSNYWRITPNWITNNTPINAGNYTLWISSSNPEEWACTPSTCFGVAEEKGICAIQNCPGCTAYISLPITLVRPELTVDPIKDIKRCCCPGYPCGELGGTDPIWINGTSGGNNCKELQVWMFGQSQFGVKNYLFTVTPIYCDDTFSFELNKGLLLANGIDLCQLATGRYEIIVQSPGANGMFDIRLGLPEENKDRFVTSTLPVTGSKVFKIEGKDALSDGVAVKYLKDGLNQPGIDDQYAHVTFNLGEKPCEGNVDFTADRNSGNLPLTVQFIDNSTMKGVSWKWYSNEILISTEQNPRYTFTTPSKYSIKLEVTDASGGINSAVKDGFITVLSAPIADFSYGPQPSGIREQVQFTDQSTGSPSSWDWDFGDGASSSLQSPVHAYAAAGTYNVTLEVSNAFGVGTPVTKQIIIVHEKPVADFIGEPTSSEFYPASVQFTDLSTGIVTAWKWEFAKDGEVVATSTDKNPKITFSQPGVYDVTLTITNNGGLNTLTKPDYITIGRGDLYQLLPGWNHVAVHKALAKGSNTAGVLFAGVDTGGNEFGIYDNALGNWTNVSAEYNVKPLEAIRVFSVTDKTIRPKFVDGGTFSRNLSVGWEGIGIVADQPVAANLILGSLGDSWDKVVAFNPVTQRWDYPYIRNVSDSNYLYPGVGYLIQMNKDGILTNGGA
jgi:PKD repeat protein